MADQTLLILAGCFRTVVAPDVIRIPPTAVVGAIQLGFIAHGADHLRKPLNSAAGEQRKCVARKSTAPAAATKLN